MMRVSMPFESWASKTAMTFGTGLLLAASATAAPRHIEKHFKVGVHPVITIHNPDGIVTIKAWTRPEVKLVGDSQSDKVEIDADQTGNRDVVHAFDLTTPLKKNGTFFTPDRNQAVDAAFDKFGDHRINETRGTKRIGFFHDHDNVRHHF